MWDPSVPIEDENPSYRIIDAINELASTLDIRAETNARREAKLNDFIAQFKAWTSQLPDPDLSQQKQIEELNKEIRERETAFQKEKQKLEQSYQNLIEEKNVEITRLQKKIKQLKDSQITNLTVVEVPKLKSEKGVEYTKLRDLLAAGEWREADLETGKVMLQAAGKESEGWLDVKDIDNFPCEDLRTINQLWLHYSDGKFGFSVQKKIYESLGGTKKYNLEVWQNFADRIGWRKEGEGTWLIYSDLTFNLKLAPHGHLPSGWEVGWRDTYSGEDTSEVFMWGRDTFREDTSEVLEDTSDSEEVLEDTSEVFGGWEVMGFVPPRYVGYSSLAQRLVTCRI